MGTGVKLVWGTGGGVRIYYTEHVGEIYVPALIRI